MKLSDKTITVFLFIFMIVASFISGFFTARCNNEKNNNNVATITEQLDNSRDMVDADIKSTGIAIEGSIDGNRDIQGYADQIDSLKSEIAKLNGELASINRQSGFIAAESAGIITESGELNRGIEDSLERARNSIEYCIKLNCQLQKYAAKGEGSSRPDD